MAQASDDPVGRPREAHFCRPARSRAIEPLVFSTTSRTGSRTMAALTCTRSGAKGFFMNEIPQDDGSSATFEVSDSELGCQNDPSSATARARSRSARPGIGTEGSGRWHMLTLTLDAPRIVDTRPLLDGEWGSPRVLRGGARACANVSRPWRIPAKCSASLGKADRENRRFCGCLNLEETPDAGQLHP